MRKKLYWLIIIAFILLGGAFFAQSIKPEVATIKPEPVNPGQKFSPSIAVWFNAGVTENQAKDLIESFGLTKYTLSDPIVWEGGRGTDIGGMAVMEVPQGSEQDYIQRFKEVDIVKNAGSSIIVE